MGQQVATYAFGGGIDTNSAALAVPPEALIRGLNYEPLAEGYGRVDGYERYDGKLAPSAAIYWVLEFHIGAAEILTGDTVTGASSGASGVVLAQPYEVTGSWGDGTAAGTLALGDVTGAFQNGEVLNVSAAPVANVAAAVTQSVAPTQEIDETWGELAQSAARALIGKVPGAGPVRGVAVHAGTVYAWRDNVGQTGCLGYRATPAGWAALTQSRRIAFTAGQAAGIAEGDTLTGNTSGATSTVVRVAVTTGSFAADDAAGWIHVVGQTGNYQAAESLWVSGTERATAEGDSTLNSFAPGGRYRCISHNFYGAANRYRLYGVCEAGHAFEMVDHVMVPILTGMADDKPTRIFEIGNHLGLCFTGGSVQLSSLGEPMVWSVVLGAAEIGFGTEITDVVQANETTVALFGERKISLLTGHDNDDFQLTALTEEAGAEPDTAQRVATTIYMDERGLRSLTATQATGGFKTGTLSARFEAYLRRKKVAGVALVGSFVCRAKSHYRIVWADGAGLAVYMGGKTPSAIPFDYGFTPTCFAGGEMDDGEAMFAGSTDGFVYRLDSGPSYDGAGIIASCMTPFNHFGAIMQHKRFHKVTLELASGPRSRIHMVAQFDYGAPDQPIDAGQNFLVRGGGGLWDEFHWDEFYWDDPIEGTAECHIDGVGRNASFVFATESGPVEPAHVLQAYSVHFSPRGMKR